MLTCGRGLLTMLAAWALAAGVVLAAFVLLQRYFVAGLTAGAVKG